MAAITGGTRGQARTAALLETALNRLDEKHRLVFLLRDVEGFSVRETSEALGLTEANVKVRLLRAWLNLENTLPENWVIRPGS